MSEVPVPAPNRRSEPRVPVSKTYGTVTFPNGRTRRRCTLFDLSAGGARLKIQGWRYLPDTFTLAIDDGSTHLAEIRSRKMGVLGIRFLT